MSTIFNSQAIGSGTTVSQSQLSSAINTCVHKTQLTTTGASNGVVQLDNSGNLTTGSSSFQVNNAGVCTKYNANPTVGIGIMPIVFSAKATGTTTGTTVLTWTPTVNMEYIVYSTFACTSFTSGSMTPTMTLTSSVTNQTTTNGGLVGVWLGHSANTGGLTGIGEMMIWPMLVSIKANNPISFIVVGTFIGSWSWSLRIVQSN